MGFTFAGIHSDQYGLKVTEIKRSISPPISTKTVKVPGKVGVYDMGIEVDELQIPIDILLMGRNLSEIRELVRNMAAWLRNNDQLGKLIIDDEPDKFYLVRMVDQTELEEVAFTGRGTITFSASDPWAYAIEDDYFTSTLNTLSFQRKGTALSQPLIEVVGESSGIGNGFEIGLNDHQMKYIGTLGVGESLVIDSYHKTAYVKKIDGTHKSALNELDRLVFPSALPNVENILTVSPVGTAVYSSVSIQCRSCWY